MYLISNIIVDAKKDEECLVALKIYLEDNNLVEKLKKIETEFAWKTGLYFIKFLNIPEIENTSAREMLDNANLINNTDGKTITQRLNMLERIARKEIKKNERKSVG